MKPLETYIEDELHRYWPGEPMTVQVEEERIIVTIAGDIGLCLIGSDDDYYRILWGSGLALTIPLMPEDNGWDDLTVEQRGYIVEMIAEQIRDCIDDEAFEQALALDKQGIADYLKAMEPDNDA